MAQNGKTNGNSTAIAVVGDKQGVGRLQPEGDGLRIFRRAVAYAGGKGPVPA